MAPPAAHAASFANAIRTDMIAAFASIHAWCGRPYAAIHASGMIVPSQTNADQTGKGNGLNHFWPL
jgi:hypothetical protein